MAKRSGRKKKAKEDKSADRSLTPNNIYNRTGFRSIQLRCLCCQNPFNGNQYYDTGFITSSPLACHLSSRAPTKSSLLSNDYRVPPIDPTYPTLTQNQSNNCFNHYLRNGLVTTTANGRVVYDLISSSIEYQTKKRQRRQRRGRSTISASPEHHSHALEPPSPIESPARPHPSFASRVLDYNQRFAPKSKSQNQHNSDATVNEEHLIAEMAESLLSIEIENEISREALEEYLAVEDTFLNLSSEEEDEPEDLPPSSVDSRPVSAQAPSASTHVPGTSNRTQAKVRQTFMDLLREHHSLAEDEDILQNDPQLQMEVGLLKLCHEYKLPISATKKFQEWARDSVRRQSIIFERPIRPRQKILEECRNHLGLRAQSPFKEKTIKWLPENKPISIHVRSLLKAIFDILMDPLAMGVDSANVRLPHASDPVIPVPDQQPTSVRQLTDGAWYRRTAAAMCDPKRREMLVPLVFACDKSHTDIYTRLNVTPFLMTLGILDIKTRRNPAAWRVLTHLLDDTAQALNQETKTVPIEKIQNLHNTLEIVLQELKELHDSGDSIEWDFFYAGKLHKVNLKFAISYVISDSEMHHKLCGSYGSFGSAMKCPCRMCDTPGAFLCCPRMFRESQMLKPQRLLFEPASYYRQDSDFQSLSQHKIKNAWYGLPWGANEYEIHLGAAPENLHVVEKGAQKRSVESLEFVIDFASRIEFERGKRVAAEDINKSEWPHLCHYIPVR